MKSKMIVFAAFAFAAAAVFGARRAGDSINNAKSLSGSQTATLVGEWDPDEKETTEDGVCYYKKTLSRGKAYTVWITGGSAEDIDLDVYTDPNYYEDREDEPSAGFDIVDVDGGATKVAYLYAEDWDNEDPATGRFIVELTGDLGASTTLHFQSGIVSFTRTGTEESPKSVSMANSWKTLTANAIEGGYYIRSALKAGRKYSVYTTRGTASSPLGIDIDPDDGMSVLEDQSRTDGKNEGWVVIPPVSATYTFLVTTSDETQKFTFHYKSLSPRKISAHPSIPLLEENNYAASFVPGRIADNNTYYDDIVDEHLCRIHLAAGERWVFETTGATTNQVMVAYDSSGKVLGRNEASGDGTKDTRLVVTPASAGLVYVGVYNPDLLVNDEPVGNPITLTARRAENLPPADGWDPVDDVIAGANMMVPWPDTTNETATIETIITNNYADAVALGAVHGPHRLGANDHEDIFAINCVANQRYYLRAAYREETTSLGLAARVFTMSGAKEVKVASTDDITDSDLSFKAGTSGVHYIRTWVKEGKGLDYPDYLMYAMVDVGTNDVGFLSVDVAGAPGTWTYNKGSYPSGATIATAPADNAVVSFAAVSGFVAPASQPVSVPAWNPGDEPVSVAAKYIDIYDTVRTNKTTKTVKGKKQTITTIYPADDTPQGAISIVPAVAAATAKRTLWKGDAADHFVFSAAAGVYYSFALDGDDNARLVVSNAVEGVLADVVSEDGRDVVKRLLPAGSTYVIVVPGAPDAEGGAYTLSYSKSAAATVKFTADKFNVKEGTEYATLTVARAGTEGAVRVKYATQAGTALPGTNYYPVTDGVLSWAAGDKANKTIKIRMVPDLVGKWAASNLTFSVVLYPVDEYDLAANEYLARTNALSSAEVVRVEATAKKPGTIQLAAYDDDPVENVKKPVVTGTAGDDKFTLTFARSGGSDGKVSVKVSTATAKGDTAKANVDYVAKTETLVWEDGDAEPKELEIELNESTGYAATKKFTLNMTAVKAATTPALAAKAATVIVRSEVVDQTAAEVAKSVAATGAKLATKGTWFTDVQDGALRSAPQAGTVTYTLTGPGFFLCEPSLVVDAGEAEDSSADFTCRFNKEAPIDCADESFDGMIARIIPAGKTTVTFTLSNVKGGAYATFTPQDDGSPCVWVPFSKVAPSNPMNKAVVTNAATLAWTVPEELVDQDGIYCRVRFGASSKPAEVVTNDDFTAGAVALDAVLEAGKTYYWALDYAYSSETNLTAEQIAELDYKAGAATWSFSIVKPGAPITSVLDGDDATGSSIADILAAGDSVTLLQGVRPDMQLGGEGEGADGLSADGFRLVGGSLPKGLTLSNGALKGVPTTPGTYTALLQGFHDEVTKTTKKVNGKKKTVTTHAYTYGTTLPVTFEVVPAGTSVGSFRGTLVEDGDTFALDARHLGNLTLSVTSAGKFTAKVAIGGVTHTFTGTGYDEVLSYDETAEGVTRQLAVTLSNYTKINKKNCKEKNTLTLYMGDGPSTNAIALAESVGRAELIMQVPNAKKTAVTPDILYTATIYRNNGGSAEGKAAMADFAGYYTAALAPEGVSAADGVPVGNGYLLMTVAAANTVKITGVLANGTSISCTTIGQLVGDDLDDPRGCVLKIPVYVGNSAHALGGVVEIAAPTNSAGEATMPVVLPAAKLLWVKNAAAVTSRGGTGFAISQAPTGGWYDKVVNLQAYYLNRDFAVQAAETGDDLPEAARASGYEFRTESTPQDLAMKFTGNAMTVASRKLVTNPTLGLYDFVGDVTTTSVNPWSVTLKFTRATGVVTGTFSAWEWKYRTVDGYTYPIAQKEIKKLAHKGVMLFSRDDSSDSPLDANVLSAGFFLMPATTSTKAKVVNATWKASLPFNIVVTDESERSWDEKDMSSETE